MKFKKLRTDEELRAIYDLMVEYDFPFCPDKFEDAKPLINQSEIFAVFNNESLAVYIILGNFKEGESAYLDIICGKNQKNIWAKPKLISAILDFLFNGFDLQYLWCEPYRTESLLMATKIGFKHLDGTEHTMILNKSDINKKYKSPSK